MKPTYRHHYNRIIMVHILRSERIYVVRMFYCMDNIARHTSLLCEINVCAMDSCNRKSHKNEICIQVTKCGAVDTL